MWKELRYWLEAEGCRLAAFAVPRFSREFLLQCAALIGWCFYRFDHRSHSVALANLACALPELSPQRHRQIALASAQNFARTFLDLFWASNLDKENHHEYVRFHNGESLRRHYQEVPGGIFVCIHQGNYEWLSICFGFHHVHAMIVAQTFKNPRLTQFFDRLRQTSGLTMTPRQNSMLRMLRMVKRGGGAGLVCDLSMKLLEGGVVINCFGMKMLATHLHCVLHQRTGVPITPVTNIPAMDGTYDFYAHDPITFPPGTSEQEIAQRVWDFFEPLIREHPELWLWGYKHFRYRPLDATREYPFYSMSHPLFEDYLTAAKSD